MNRSQDAEEPERTQKPGRRHDAAQHRSHDAHRRYVGPRQVEPPHRRRRAEPGLAEPLRGGGEAVRESVRMPREGLDGQGRGEFPVRHQVPESGVMPFHQVQQGRGDALL